MSPAKSNPTVLDNPDDSGTAPSELDELKAIIAEQNAKIAQMQAQVNAPPPDPNDSGPGYKYKLTLSDGSVHDYQGAVPTHYALGDQVFDVVMAFRQPE